LDCPIEKTFHGGSHGTRGFAVVVRSAYSRHYHLTAHISSLILLNRSNARSIKLGARVGFSISQLIAAKLFPAGTGHSAKASFRWLRRNRILSSKVALAS
jgi:hypothetical protein